ncbi:MAG TPA: DUF5615 family PIN-like protein [Dehalococcoidia bacterium]|jgi:predicted nuclease of predicted toxin-antitoxin system
MRLYLDEDVPLQVAEPLHAAGFDVLTTRDAGRLQAQDFDQLQFAASERRVLVTRNRDDFVEFTVRFFDEGRPHSGVLVLSASFGREDFGGMARAIVAYFHGHPHEMQAYLVDFVSPL